MLNQGRIPSVRAILSAGLAMAAVTWTVPGSAADRESGDDFTVYSDGSQRRVIYVDHLPTGSSIGDQRIGYRSMADGDGNQVGDFRWTATVVEVAGSEDERPQTAAVGMFSFPGGEIFTVRPAAPTYVAPDTVSEIAGQGDLLISGGAGVFRSANGVVRRDPDAAHEVYAFEIACD